MFLFTFLPGPGFLTERRWVWWCPPSWKLGREPMSSGFGSKKQEKSGEGFLLAEQTTNNQRVENHLFPQGHWWQVCSLAIKLAPFLVSGCSDSVLLRSLPHSLSSWTLYFLGLPLTWQAKRLDFLGQSGQEVSFACLALCTLDRPVADRTPDRPVVELSFAQIVACWSCQEPHKGPTWLDVKDELEHPDSIKGTPKRNLRSLELDSCTRRLRQSVGT